jgi:hypothetical protein
MVRQAKATGAGLLRKLQSAVYAFLALGIAACGGNNSRLPIPVITATPTPRPTATATAVSSITATPSTTATPGITATPGTTATPTASPTPGGPLAATNSSIIAIDCKRQLAFVPLDFLADDGHGQIAVLDLSVDPDHGDPLLKKIDLGFTALPRAAAADPASGTVLALADDVLHTGTLLQIDESTDALTPVSFPAGSRPSETSGVVLNPANNTALVAMSDALDDCTQSEGFCTGAAVFDRASQSFGPLYVTLSDVDNLALDPKTQASLGTADPLLSILLAFDLKVSTMFPCELDDKNVKDLFADPDSVAVDPVTGIWVVGNFSSPIASVVNLNGSGFSGAGTEDCHLNEGGTPPNSVNHDTATGADGMPGAAINPFTHQAFMTAAGDKQIALLSLPSSPVTQLAAADVSSVHSSIPNDPTGTPFIAANFPYATAVDTCNNFGYVTDDQRRFLVRVDLAQLEKNPAAISTALPAGSCASTPTAFRCGNGQGVTFFPLPRVTSAAVSLTQFSIGNDFHARKKAAKPSR